MRTAIRRYCIAFVIFYLQGFTQTPDTLWTRTYGGNNEDIGYSLLQTSDGGYIIAGSTRSTGNGEPDVYLIKIDENGDTIWTQTYGRLDFDYAYDVCETFDSGFAVVGRTYSLGGTESDVYLIRTNANGDTLWTEAYGGGDHDWGTSVSQTADSGFIIAGTTMSIGAGWQDIFLIKTDLVGNMIWGYPFGWNFMDFGNSLAITPDNGYIVIGGSYSTTNGAGDIIIIKTNSTGSEQWRKIYGSNVYEWGMDITVTSDNGFIATGERTATGEIRVVQQDPSIDPVTGIRTKLPQRQNSNVWMLKLNASGDTSWTSNYGGAERDIGYSVQEHASGGFIVAGGKDMMSGTHDEDVYIVRSDANGDSIWSLIYGGTSDDCARSIQQTTDNGYIAVGYTHSFDVGGGDVWLLRISSESGTNEKQRVSINTSAIATVFSGQLELPSNAPCKIFDITGCEIQPRLLAPGIYFIEIEGKITQKIIKVR